MIALAKAEFYTLPDDPCRMPRAFPAGTRVVVGGRCKWSRDDLYVVRPVAEPHLSGIVPYRLLAIYVADPPEDATL